MTYCAVKGCHNASHNNKKKIPFHGFPTDPIIATLWLGKLRLNRKDNNWKPTKNTKICSVHFDENMKYLTKGGLCKLKTDAVPTKHLHICCIEGSQNSDDVLMMGALSQDSDENINIETPASSQQEPMERRNQGQGLIDTNAHLLKKKNFSLHTILVHLRKERFIDNDISNILSENVFSAELYNLVKKNAPKNEKQPMPKHTYIQFRKFCLNLHFYAPRAYIYVRQTFDSCLPHIRTIYNWYCTKDGSPGLTGEAFKVLQNKAKYSEKKLICCLVADEMAIHPKNIKGGHGQVDFGAGTSEYTSKATEAYAFILVCLNENWKIPIGYFLVHGLSGRQKSSLIKMCLTKCDEVGVKVVALTFDAHASNISAMEILGCKIKDPKNMKTTFKHPTTKHEVAVFLDSNHMVKLVKNYIEDKQELLDQDRKNINWEFLANLNEVQEKKGLDIPNNLTRGNLELKNSIMRIKLASQLLSRSAAVALKFSREELKLDSFIDSEATENFIMILNNLFDIFNSRNLTQHGYCHPLCLENKTEMFDYLYKAKSYLLNLHIKNTRKRTFNESVNSNTSQIKSFQSVLAVKCSLGFKGLLVCIESLLYIFNTLVENKRELTHIHSYRFSQDHIELFFASIRMIGGHDNLNALQFKNSYKKLLSHIELQAGETGSCVPVETIAILTCSSALKCINSSTLAERFDDAEEELINVTPIADDFAFEMESFDDPDYQYHVIGCIAGKVVRYIMTRIKCQFCVDNMLAREYLWFHKLVYIRDKGGLIYASKEVYSICSVAETCLRNYIKQNAQISNSEKELTLKIMVQLTDRYLFPDVDEHVNSKHHDTNLARLIVEQYLKIRYLYESKKDNFSRLASSKRYWLRKQL